MTTLTNKFFLKGSWQWWQPLLIGILVALLVLLAFGLRRDASSMPSALIGRIVPDFSLSTLDGNSPIHRADLFGKPAIINFWASWCGACRQEHAVLIKLGQRLTEHGDVRMLGINYKDTTTNAERFLKLMGAFPYPSVLDVDARTGIDFGVFGLPETYFVDARGVVRARHIGPLTEADAEKYLRIIGGRP